MTRPLKHRLDGTGYPKAISGTKTFYNLSFKTLAEWMGVTTSNLTGMMSKKLNPTKEEWNRFKVGLKCYQVNRISQIRFIPKGKLRLCRRKRCKETFILFAHNKLDCDSHTGKSKKKYPIV